MIFVLKYTEHVSLLATSSTRRQKKEKKDRKCKYLIVVYHVTMNNRAPSMYTPARWTKNFKFSFLLLGICIFLFPTFFFSTSSHTERTKFKFQIVQVSCIKIKIIIYEFARRIYPHTQWSIRHSSLPSLLLSSMEVMYETISLTWIKRCVAFQRAITMAIERTAFVAAQ